MVPVYNELVQQNWGFLSTEQQETISRTTVLLAGCGLGSNIAILAARTGFCRFILADGDVVEPSNLNRQAFRAEHVGINKAEATSAMVAEVNPAAQVQVVPTYVGAEDAAPLVEQADVVVNMVDPGPALDALLDAAKEQSKITLFPMNVGFGGVVLAFGPDSPTLGELIGSDVGDDLFVRMVMRLMPCLPSYLWRYAWVAQRIQRDHVPPPQLGVAAAMTSSLVTGNMVRVALGSTPPLVPTVMTLDAYEPTRQTWPVNGDRPPPP